MSALSFLLRLSLPIAPALARLIQLDRRRLLTLGWLVECRQCVKPVAPTRRKIILGGLLIDAASKDQRFASIVSELTHRISRDQDKKPFEGWSLPKEDR